MAKIVKKIKNNNSVKNVLGTAKKDNNNDDKEVTSKYQIKTNRTKRPKRNVKRLRYDSDSDSDSDYNPDDNSDDDSGKNSSLAQLMIVSLGGMQNNSNDPLHDRKRRKHDPYADETENDREIRLKKDIVEHYEEDKYFEKLSDSDKKKIIDEELKIKLYNHDATPLEYRIILSNIPTNEKNLLLERVRNFYTLRPSDSEYGKLCKWMRGLAKIPFGKYISLPVSHNDEQQKIAEFLNSSYNKLNQSTYGQFKAKNRIIEVIAQWIANPNSKNKILALQGSAGVGKTNLIKNGVSTAFGLPFVFFSLGGMRDISHFEGHNYTWEGSTWGKTVQSLMDSKCMNPIIFMDELDKIGETDHGQEVSKYLIHLTDFTQNNSVRDLYYSDMTFDFSKCFFVFSFNYIDKINPILKDRLDIIEMEKYSLSDKIEIAKQHLIPGAMKDSGLKPDEFKITDDAIRNIIETYVPEEEGVRNIKRAIEYVSKRCNIHKFMKNLDDTSFHKNIKGFENEVNTEVLKEIMKDYKTHHENTFHRTMYI